MNESTSEPRDNEPIADPELEAFLDQTPEDRAAAAQAEGFNQTPERLAQIELQSRIDTKLREGLGWAASATPPALPDFESANAPTAPSGSASPGSRGSVLYRFTRPMRLAAAILVVAVLGAAIAFYANPFGQASLASVYRAEIEAGFVPGWVCETETEFIETFTKRFQTPLRLREAVGLEAIGLTYNYALGPQTVMLLTRVEGEPVIVFIGSTRLVETAPAVGDRDLAVFEKQIGGVRLFELTPFDQPRVLEQFEIVESPRH